MFVDFHIHTEYSDGSYTCRQVLEKAASHKVHMIAVTDHNTTAEYPELRAIAPSFETVKIVPGVEFDALLNGRNHHILGLGVDVENPRLVEACAYCAEAQEASNQKLLKMLCEDYPMLDFQEYLDYTRPSGCGGWKLLSYLKEKGAAQTLRDAIMFYREYGVSSNNIPFLSDKEICDVIYESGGIPILAHPVVDIRKEPLSQEFFDTIREHLKNGIAEVECFYPRHSAAVEEGLVQFCKEHDLYISGGTDCHGEFFGDGKQEIGGQFVEEKSVEKLVRELRYL